MRLILAAGIFLFAGAAAAQDFGFETREGCLRQLRFALADSGRADETATAIIRAMERAPITDRDALEAASHALRTRAQADIDYAEALLLICQSYD
jgi:predicted DNA-binding transcriptional regulator YafY